MCIRDRSNVRSFKEIASLKALEMSANIQEAVFVKLHPSLADILVGNLLKNAIRHNIEKGWIQIDLSKQQLSIKNSGQPPSIPTNHLFERFRKSNQSSNSLGLGLAIVKKICEVSGYKASYQFQQGVHHLTVDLQ